MFLPVTILYMLIRWQKIRISWCLIGDAPTYINGNLISMETTLHHVCI